MIVSHAIKPFRRFGVVLKESIWIDGQPYFTAPAIADWLGLKDRDDAVSKIVRRNPYIIGFSKKVEVLFEEEYGTQKDRPARLAGQCPLQNPENAYIFDLLSRSQVKIYETFACLPCLKGREKEEKRTLRTRKVTLTVFDPIGLQLIAMESHTKKAKQFKVASAKVLWAMYVGKLVELDEEQESAERILELWAKAPRGSKKRFRELYVRKTGKTRATAFRDLKRFKKGESPADKDWKNAIKPVISGDIELRIREIFFKNPTITSKDIWRKIGSPKKPSYSRVKDFIRKLRRELRDGLDFMTESQEG